MFENITLELSLKPFKQTDETYIRKVCAQIFEQWRPLLKKRKSISIMLWVRDGSEILDYAGNLEDIFEWARFVGTANLPYLEDGEPLETSLHKRKQDYIQNAPVMTYGILKTIISCLKEEGKKAFPEATVRVGETFDIEIVEAHHNRKADAPSGTALMLLDAVKEGCEGEREAVFGRPGRDCRRFFPSPPALSESPEAAWGSWLLRYPDKSRTFPPCTIGLSLPYIV